MKEIVFMVLCVIGLYVVLDMFTILNRSIGTFAGVTFTWFGLLFVAGSLLIFKAFHGNL